MARFYTKKGDDGYTGLLGEGRAQKHDQQIETVGAIDEANAAIALARTFSKASQIPPILVQVQRDLYHLMAEIAATPAAAPRFRKITAEQVAWLEAQIDDLSSLASVPDEFIIPGDSQAGAAIDLARTVVRRAERHTAHLLHLHKIENRELLRYLNRLSSLLYIAELVENQAAGVTHPKLAKE